MASLESLGQVGLEGFLFQDCLFQGWSRGIWTITVYLWSTAPRTSLGSLDQVGLLVRFTFHRVGNITLKVLHISGKMFDDLSVTFCGRVFQTKHSIAIHRSCWQRNIIYHCEYFCDWELSNSSQWYSCLRWSLI